MVKMITSPTVPTKTRRRHPLLWYFALAYAISWPFWVLSRLTGGTVGIVMIVVGGFGPMLAAAIVLRWNGESLTEWLRGINRWRVPISYYVYVLGLPVLIMAAMNLVLAALGQQPGLSTPPDRVPAYLHGCLLTAVIFGRQEDPGWRGFALRRLEQRYSAIRATLILGLGWG